MTIFTIEIGINNGIWNLFEKKKDIKTDEKDKDMKSTIKYRKIAKS